MVGDSVAVELSAMMEDDSSVMMGCRAGLRFLLCAEERRMHQRNLCNVRKVANHLAAPFWDCN